MSSISNRFYITALEDGTTLHGNLAADGSLSQAWNGQSAVPDWTVPTNQPTIYLTLLSGGDLVEPANDFKWLYNGVEIADSDTRFQKTTREVTIGSTTKSMPALKIVANLANSHNVDVDLITFQGNYIINGTGISFSATAQIRISEIAEGSSLGVINFHNGVSDITTKGQNIVAYGLLYNPDGTPNTSVTTKWYLNDSSTPTAGTTIEGHANAFQVSEGDVVDHATLRCEFYKNTNLIYTAYASIDDMQDPEFMYVQYNGNNGNAASLRKGDTATFKIWVGTRTDPTPIGGKATPTYNSIKVKLLDGDGNVIMDSGLGTSIPNPDAEGWRSLNSTMSEGVATITPNYDTVNGVGKKNLTGIILAETASNNSNT